LIEEFMPARLVSGEMERRFDSDIAGGFVLHHIFGHGEKASYFQTGEWLRRLAQGVDRGLDLAARGGNSVGNLAWQVCVPIMVGVARIDKAVQLLAQLELFKGRLEMAAD
jgi:hypothetical protein